MLKIRGFVKGRDEGILVKIYNATFGTYDDARSVTLEEVKKWEEAPSFSTDGIFIAEWNGEPGGIVNAYVDSLRKEEKGFIQLLGVLPEFRNKGIAKKLVERALESLKQTGMKIAGTMVQNNREACIRIFEKFRFKQVRCSSMMKRTLTPIPSQIRQNNEVSIMEMLQEDENQVILLNRLENEAFQEHFDFRPKTIEETRYVLFESPFFEQRAFFAVLKEKPVGFVIVGTNDELNRQKNEKLGWIMDIGVLKPFRRRGIGASLILHSMKLLRSERMTDAVLYVDDMNPAGAKRFYEELGFEVIIKNLTYQLLLE